MKKKETYIPNFCFFGVKGVFLDVFAIEHSDEVFYNPTVTVFLDDDREHEPKAVTLNMDNFIADEDGIEEMVKDLAGRLCVLFSEIGDQVSVYDIDGECVAEYSLAELTNQTETIQ
jgi:hypothetical protein